MPCEVCGHTINNLGLEDCKVYWCPRCGTLTEKTYEENQKNRIDMPKLASLIRKCHTMSVVKDSGRYQVVPAKIWQEIMEAAGLKAAKASGTDDDNYYATRSEVEEIVRSHVEALVLRLNANDLKLQALMKNANDPKRNNLLSESEEMRRKADQLDGAGQDDA